MATFLELQNEVLAHGFDSNTYRARVKNWLNEAQGRIARRVQLRQVFTSSTITTENGSSTYVLPIDLVRINGVVDADSPLELRYVEDPDDILVANENGLSSGRPTHYSLAAGGLLLYPVPDAEYTLTLSYYASPSPMEEDDDVSELPEDYHDVMVSYALSRAYRSEDDPQMSTFFYNEYMRDLSQMAADRQFEVRDAPRQVPGTWNVP